MSPSRVFVLRPAGTTLLMVALLLVGIVAYQFLPVSTLPEVDYPTIQVSTFYPGASPEVMTTAVTAPLERQFGEMPGLDQMSSISSGGASVITLQFTLDLSLDVAEQEVQAAINAANGLLPTDLPAPPVYAKINPANAPVVTLAVSSKTLALTDVEDLTDIRIAQKLSQLPGVGLVSLAGGMRPAVRIEVNPRALASYGIAIDDIRTDITNENTDTPKGNFDGPAINTTINDNDQLQSAEQYANLILGYRNGNAIRLSQVARIVNGAQNSELAAWANKTPAVIVNVQRQPGSNVLAVADSVTRLLPTLKKTLPAALDVKILSDQTTTIRASISDVEFELGLAVVLVVLVIFLFLRTWQATVIPSLSVPLSLVGTLAGMYLFGFSLDTLSLMSLTIASGFVVDDAIVMIENITRYIEMGESPIEAALKGSGEIGFTIISLTVSLIAVLIPLLFMGGVIGRLFYEFSVTLGTTIVLSAIVSLTLVPMLCAKILRRRTDEKRGRFDLAAERVFERTIGAYDRGLIWVLDHQGLTLAVALATLVVTAFQFIEIPKGFFPVQDTGQIQAISYAAPDVSFAEMQKKQQDMANVILADPSVASLSSTIGVDGTNTTLNSGRFLITLKPLDGRAGVSDVIRRISREAANVTGISLAMQPVQDLTIDSTVGRAQYLFFLANPDQTQNDIWAPKLVARMKQMPEFQDVETDLGTGARELQLAIDRPTAARFGITPATIDNVLYDAFGQRIASTLFTQSNQYRVILNADLHGLPSLDRALDGLYVPSSTATAGEVPLAAIVHMSQQSGPLELEHLGQTPSTTISFNLAPGASLGSAASEIRTAERDIGLPDTFVTSFQGALSALQQSLNNEFFLILAAIVAVYIVLGVLYESFIHPITILSTLPSAGVGALLALRIAGAGLDIIGIIGIILLIGIVKKNAIMMIDFALRAERLEQKPPREAIHQAALLRFRPILMTTMAALFAALPLMLGFGVGSELRRPLGIAIVGGLIVSQMLTLFTTPVIYLYFDRGAIWFRRRFGAPPQEAPAG
ncbi:MAG TPA: efflux RND transporter permease subunit [Rhizomicrobium sp.]|jgi:multidrug efflux pump|nr:efflux RND transporter permease subunit [Rhizomicrobium sp.]